ncbi:uncharacterized protein BDW70DRAFT_165134 [Aspergillus foveolatus]|uniref:uncharacterized protein n=1 Tax=Aspergillus foveolatus TaxID=210207 RepID=UPI003CCD522E
MAGRHGNGSNKAAGTKGKVSAENDKTKEKVRGRKGENMSGSEEDDILIERDDPFPRTWADAQLGVVIIDVRLLDPKWSDEIINRELDEGHVASLKEEFRNGIRRTEPENFMRASVSQEEWNKLLEAVVTGISTSTIPCPVSLQDVPSVENLSRLAKDTSTISTCTTPNHALLIPQNAIDWKLCLEAGQHRQAALFALNKEQDTLSKTDKGRKAGIKQSTSEDYLWPVSLYLRDKLDAESLTALRANRDKVSKSDANGDLLVRVLYLLEQKSMADRATLLKGQKKMKVWLVQAHGASSSNTARLLNILRSDLCAGIAQYCRTRYGASHFTVTWGSNVVLGSLDFVSCSYC